MKIKLEETANKRRLHIGSFFVDLNECEYQDLVKIFKSPIQNAEVTRFEVIDHTDELGEARAFSKRGEMKVELSYQDDGRTLKVFLTKQKDAVK